MTIGKKPLVVVMLAMLVAIFLAGVAVAVNPWGMDETIYPVPPQRNITWDLVRDEFDSCAFGYGVTYRSYYQGFWEEPTNVFNFDYVAIWLGDAVATWNKWWIGQALTLAINYNKPLMIYAYVIAESAKGNLDITDCDVDPNLNLCTKGANWIRSNWTNNIIPQYKLAAETINSEINKWNIANPNKKYTRSILWNMEPDYQQYRAAPDTRQEGGGIPDATLAGKYFMEMLSTISKYQTAAKNRFFTDISPWLNAEYTPWMELYPNNWVDGFYGGFNAASDYVKDHNYNWVTYNDTNALYGGNTRPIIAQGGWGVNGADTETYTPWLNATNVVARQQNYVLASTFSNTNITKILEAMYDASRTGASTTTCFWNGIRPEGGNNGNNNTDPSGGGNNGGGNSTDPSGGDNGNGGNSTDPSGGDNGNSTDPSGGDNGSSTEEPSDNGNSSAFWTISSCVVLVATFAAVLI